MQIDDLIHVLQQVRTTKGNIKIQASAACGTNQSHVLFDINPLKNKKFEVARHINGHGVFCLGLEISEATRQQIKESVANMSNDGETFYRSQFVNRGEMPKPGLSPCEWHNPW